MKLLVMGAGYVGMALLRSFQDQVHKNHAHEIFITTTEKEKVKLLEPYGKFVLLLEQTEDHHFQELINKCEGIVILVAPKNSQNYEQTYLHTAKRITSALEGRKTPFYILYTSSTLVCEGAKLEWVSEDIKPFPTSEKAKILFETEFQYLNCGTDVCVLRLGGIYGPQRELIDRAGRFSGKEMDSRGDEPTNHIHVEDIVSAIHFCLKGRLKGIYHLVNDEHSTRKVLYNFFCQSAGLPLPIWSSSFVPEEKRYKIANKKIKEAGFRFLHPFILNQEIKL